MSENHCLIEVHDETLPNGLMCLRGRLSGEPSRRWIRGVTAQLSIALVGHPGIGRLTLNDRIVEGDEFVLQAVEKSEVPELRDALEQAVAGTNDAIAAHDARSAIASSHADRPLVAGIPQGGREPWRRTWVE